MAVRAIRGAIQLDANERAAVLEGTSELVTEVMSRNRLTPAEVISVVFTATHDLDAEFPALAARKLGFQDVPLLCATEMNVPGSMPLVVRLMMHVETEQPGARCSTSTCAARSRSGWTSRNDAGRAAAWLPASPGGDRDRPDRHLGGAGRRGMGAAVWLADSDPAAARFAAGLGAGAELPPAGPPGGPAEIAVLAMPPGAVAPALAAAQARGLARCYTDVASVKELPLARARELGCDLATFVPGHPLAGRERSGPAAARADLFLGRPWAICPAPETLRRGDRRGDRAGQRMRRAASPDDGRRS